MVTSICRFVLFNYLIVLVSFSAISQQTDELNKQQAVRFIANDWCPQHCENHQNKNGYIVDIVTRAFELENIPFTLDYGPWLRAIRLTKSGEYDGLLTPLKSEFPEGIFHNEPISNQQYCIYVKKTFDWVYQKPEDFNGLNVAYLTGSGIGDLQNYFDKNDKKKLRVQLFTGVDGYVETIFQFLELGRTDAIIITSDVFEFSLLEHKVADVFTNAGCLKTESLYAGLSPANKQRSMAIAASLDSGLKKLKISGEWQEILKRYGMTSPP